MNSIGKEYPDTVIRRLKYYKDLGEKGWVCFPDVLGSLTEEDLLKTNYIRNEPLTAIDAITRQLAHYTYHIGQIIYIGKIVKDKDWKNLSIPLGQSMVYTQKALTRDPAKKYS